MGWFSSAPSGPVPKKAADGGAIAPDRSSRAQCYIARDTFFNCLDENSIIDAIKEDGPVRSKCPKEIKDFEDACSKTWVKYFKEKRVMEWKRDQTIEKIKREDAEMTARLKAEEGK
ncbi:hypothetical protein AJ80_03135 [Polytolypa hystricis UAMH7299]|uniref:Cytochrome c oxidase assembly factor 6 n=1 Tax=Polytolypa hystricis (strain UAMH7299) TaxID=1447883 RepID=A0A2B7YJS8_POLH7|nr:hypothetical protein AJ80_03135 [Polytolypa hystricis UAMH7299]